MMESPPEVSRGVGDPGHHVDLDVDVRAGGARKVVCEALVEARHVGGRQYENQLMTLLLELSTDGQTDVKVG